MNEGLTEAMIDDALEALHKEQAKNAKYKQALELIACSQDAPLIARMEGIRHSSKRCWEGCIVIAEKALDPAPKLN